MFNKTNSQSTPANADSPQKKPVQRSMTPTSAPSILARDLIITGDIKTDGEVQIDGRLDGNIKASVVIVGEQGAVNGKIACDSVHVRGKVTGKVDATSVELSETANVQADLVQDKLVIANGAFFDGKCSRKTTAPTKLKASSPSKPA